LVSENYFIKEIGRKKNLMVMEKYTFIIMHISKVIFKKDKQIVKMAFTFYQINLFIEEDSKTQKYMVMADFSKLSQK